MKHGLTDRYNIVSETNFDHESKPVHGNVEAIAISWSPVVAI